MEFNPSREEWARLSEREYLQAEKYHFMQPLMQVNTRNEWFDRNVRGIEEPRHVICIA